MRPCKPQSASLDQAELSAASVFLTMRAIPGSEPAFYNNIIVGGSLAPVRAYIEEPLPDVLEGRIEPGFVDADGVNKVPGGYRALDQRKSFKVAIKP